MIKFKEDNRTSKFLIESIWFLNEHGDTMIAVNYNLDKNNEKLYYITEYHGDHSENWVIKERAGKEIERHNTKFIASIIWSDRLNQN
ncbi:MAG: hypothetical protein UR73_C0038G0010 [candidate division WS6 bacterium GW2011_GWF1_35_23]|uniref:Uncharacterized protein n=1 Tax=candidate division WS6 bacterium GW2011_GWF1_35_23 TaxID=1619097 RepID=A0A0G0F4Z8_9BACT|nr:MAG: hypothetical protein UR73_C0038G0010 [candidate division WS6 bacterium GW2011_GWF1_35_23]KKQ29794.1 MAG: hypothetical protein US46_C0017G0010 [Candidatus Shapirobacteria bacterium GW2011_GWF2_37_20]